MVVVRRFFTNRYLLWLTVAALLTNAALWTVIITTPEPQEELVPLHYNIYFGIDLVGPWWYLYILPAAGSAVFLLNTVLATALVKKEQFTSFFLVVANGIIQGILLFTMYLLLTQI